jgi:hypothetical protein
VGSKAAVLEGLSFVPFQGRVDLGEAAQVNFWAIFSGTPPDADAGSVDEGSVDAAGRQQGEQEQQQQGKQQQQQQQQQEEQQPVLLNRSGEAVKQQWTWMYFGREVALAESRWGAEEAASEVLPFILLFTPLRPIENRVHSNTKAITSHHHSYGRTPHPNHTRNPRALPSQFTLKARRYLGPTSMDAEMAFVMANMVRPAGLDDHALLVAALCVSISIVLPCTAMHTYTNQLKHSRP